MEWKSYGILQDPPQKYTCFGSKGYGVRDCLHPRGPLPLPKKPIASNDKDKAQLRKVFGDVKSAMLLAQSHDRCSVPLGQAYGDERPRATSIRHFEDGFGIRGSEATMGLETDDAQE